MINDRMIVELERLLRIGADLLESLAAKQQADKELMEKADRLLEPLDCDDAGEGSRASREDFATNAALNPASLGGSWFHRIRDGVIVWQGVVVAEVSATPMEGGVYLVELHNWAGGESAHQRLISVRQILEDEASGNEWRFYDDDTWMRAATSRSQSYELVEKPS